MTVTYTAEVATCTRFGCFLKLLARWRGSIYKLVWMDLLLFLLLFYLINLLYIYGLEDDRKKTFEAVVEYCSSYVTLIPLSFVLGFYVNLVMQRWWEQYMTIPWPDSLAVLVSAHVQGDDEGGRVMRRTIMRYVCACCTMVLSMISPCVKKRFPKLHHLVEAGLLQENEKQIIEDMNTAFPNHPKHWMPIVWATSIVARARKEGRIRDDYAVKTLIDTLNSFRGSCGTLMYYDFITVPLVYTQVVTIAVYSFFICSLLAHQWTIRKADTYESLDFYTPVFMTLQFFFYMGWLKVAETLINPFGEDDDDFEVNWMIDRHLQVSYMIVDEMHQEHPELVKDQYWDEVFPNELPYETDVKREKPPEHSTAKYDKEYNAPTHSGQHSLASLDKSRGRLTSVFSQRSEQFNQTFQRYSTLSDNELPPMELKSKTHLLETGSLISATESIQTITSYYLPRPTTRTILQPYFFEAILEDVEEGLYEDDYDDRIESKSTDKGSSEPEYELDLFDRLRLERQQQRVKRMNDYLEDQFGSNFRLAYKDPMPRPAKKIQTEAGKDEMNEVQTLFKSDNMAKIRSPAKTQTVQFQDEVQFTPKYATVATSPMESFSTLSVVSEDSRQAPVTLSTIGTSPMESASTLSFVATGNRAPQPEHVILTTSPMPSGLSILTVYSSETEIHETSNGNSQEKKLQRKDEDK
ncbi:bestrophin-4-like [Glossina fuscipes]|uniref:Bestrophin homolog n=1 Tax=Glossina fuscipes TaxID=7396 RepID=A0A8U0W7U1_9MUSC|nr:bestrophin-4-like [Glossina fuscipes]